MQGWLAGAAWSPGILGRSHSASLNIQPSWVRIPPLCPSASSDAGSQEGNVHPLACIAGMQGGAAYRAAPIGLQHINALAQG